MDGEAIPDPITPELLLRGYDLLLVNLIPELQNCPEPYSDRIYSNQTSKIKSNLSKLSKVRENLINIYHNKFLVALVNQALAVKSCYKPVNHFDLDIDDLVILKEPNLKPDQYQVCRNILNEVTHVELFKGKTGEIVRHHVSVLIPYLKYDKPDNDSILPDSKIDSNINQATRLLERLLFRQDKRLKTLSKNVE